MRNDWTQMLLEAALFIVGVALMTTGFVWAAGPG